MRPSCTTGWTRSCGAGRLTRPSPAAGGPETPAARPAWSLLKKFAFPALLVAVLVGAACLVIDMRRLGELLLQARPWPLAGLLACHLASLLLHSLRMHVLLRRSIPLRVVFHANNICNMANSVLPLRAGEFAMALLLAGRSTGGVPAMLSTIFVDRLLGLLSILAIFLAALPSFSPHGAAALGLVHSAIYYILAFGGMALLLFVVTALEEPLVVLTRWALSRLPLHTERTVDKLRACISGLRVLFHLRTSLPVFVLALGTWVCIIALNYCGLLAILPEPSVTAAVFVTFLTIVGIMLVPTPSGLGTMHGASVLVLSMFGVGAEQALAYAILAHALVTVANILLGMWSAQRMDFRLGRALRSAGVDEA
jgi:glycosyltransferase 2 family protein